MTQYCIMLCKFCFGKLKIEKYSLNGNFYRVSKFFSKSHQRSNLMFKTDRKHIPNPNPKSNANLVDLIKPNGSLYGGKGDTGQRWKLIGSTGTGRVTGWVEILRQAGQAV